MTDYNDYYVNLLDKSASVVKERKSYSRRSLPKIGMIFKKAGIATSDSTEKN